MKFFLNPGVIDEFRQNMRSYISNNTALTTYRYLKTNFVIENYLKILTFKYMLFHYISRLTLSSHSLRIETGRIWQR